jgi:uncharacterized membrane protein
LAKCKKILLSRILYEVSRRGMYHDEQFGLRPQNSTALPFTRLVERASRNFDEKSLTGADFLEVSKVFDTLWFDGLLYNLTILNFLRIWSKPKHHT